MADYILLILWSSLFIFGWDYATLYTKNIENKVVGDKTIPIEHYPLDTKKEIAWWFRYYTRNLPTYIKKPLITCVMCMASLYGSLFYWVYVLNTEKPITSLTLVLWVVTVVAISGLNRILKQIAQI